MIIKGKGFTLVELILVMVLIAILSVVGIGLFSSPSQYHSANAQEQWLNMLQYVQRQALIKQNLINPLTLSIQRNSNDWQFVLSQGSAIIEQIELPHHQQVVRYSNSQFSALCQNLSALPAGFQIHFDGSGNHVNSNGSNQLQNLRICFDPQHQLCVSPSGFAYGGNCVP